MSDFKQASNEILELIAAPLGIIKFFEAPKFADKRAVMVRYVSGLGVQVVSFGLTMSVTAARHRLSLLVYRALRPLAGDHCSAPSFLIAAEFLRATARSRGCGTPDRGSDVRSAPLAWQARLGRSPRWRRPRSLALGSCRGQPHRCSQPPTSASAPAMPLAVPP